MALPPIRPSVTPQAAPPARPAADAARAAAQRAFFQAAMGGEVPTTPAPRPVDPVMGAQKFTPQASQRASIPEEPPQRILRPGSFLDIKV
jgi:hypothetical protein